MYIKHSVSIIMQAEWLNNGYVIVRDAVDVTGATDELKSLLPASESDVVHEFGNGGVAEFPCGPVLDTMTVHPKLLWIVRQCLGTERIVLTQSVAWAKYGGQDMGSNADQRVHMDFGNNYWGFPPAQPDMLAAIIYYSDTDETGGATAVVPRNASVTDNVYNAPFAHMPGMCGLPFINNRESAEAMMSEASPVSSDIRAECYAREIVPRFKPGDILLYRMDTWHRGTPVNDGQIRYAHNLAWRKADADGIEKWNGGFTRAMYSGSFERFISSLNPGQLETIGFPPRDSPLWKNEEYCSDVRHRYEWAGFDLNAYIRMPKEPPPVPQHWFFSKYVLQGDQQSPKVFRDKTLKTLSELGAVVDIADSNWHWTIQYCDGPHYISADMFVFMSEGQPMVDMNQLQGDRYTWIELFRDLQRGAKRAPTPTHMPMVPSLKSKNIEALCMVGIEQTPEVLLPFLNHEDPSVVRAAMYRLTFFDRAPHDCSSIQKWLSKPLQNFLERETAKHAAAVMQKQSKL